MKPFELISFATPGELARAAAAAWVEEIKSANRAARAHCAALSGGRIAPIFFAATVEQAQVQNASFANVHFFWADERCVPPADPDSNFRLAREHLLAPLKVPERLIHRIRGEDFPKAAAQTADAELRRTVPADRNGRPSLDLIFLGLGEDGHVASLFPGEPEAVISDGALYRAITHAPKPPPDRITLGYAALAAARQVWVLVSGAGKEAALRESLRPGSRTPLGRIGRARSGIKIFCDFRLD